MKEELLLMRGITKKFPGIIANDNVNLTVYKGEVHALLGENGAGKSTLMNILSGIYYPNSGFIKFRGRIVNFKSPKDAVKLGIGMVHQHFKLVETLTVSENIFLYANRCSLVLDHKKMDAEVERFSKEYELPINPKAKVKDLSVGEQQRVEILKLLFCGADVLILDEPTAVLTPQEVDSLFSALRKMAESGKTILLIAHKLDEIMQVADRVTVLRNGKNIDSVPIAECTPASIAELMMGKSTNIESEIRKKQSAYTDVVLEAEGLNVNNNLDVTAVKDVSLCVKRGEILGIAGISGNGQLELAEALAGIRNIKSGVIKLSGEVLENHSARTAIEHGIAYVPDDRLGTGLVGPMGIPQNVILKYFKSNRFSRFGFLRGKEIEKYASDIVEKYDVRNAGMGKPVSLMSGGNMQKLLIGRELTGNPSLIIAMCPTRGLDVGATKAIQQILSEESEKGTAVILISEDLDELMALSDRISVICGGEIIDTVIPSETNIHEIGRLMTGMKRGAAE